MHKFNESGLTEFPPESGMKIKAELKCQLETQSVVFEGKIVEFLYEEKCEIDPERSAHIIEFENERRITILSRDGVIEFWTAENVDIQCDGDQLVVRPRAAA